MSKNLIYSRRPDFLPMTPMEIEQRAPAVYAIDKAPHLSERYHTVTTGNAIKIMMDHGFYPVQAAQVGRGLHAKHMLAFSPEYKPSSQNELRAEILLYNAHDGTSSLRLLAGALRFVCTNGIVCGTEAQQARLRHTASTVSAFETLLEHTAKQLPNALGRIDSMRSQRLSYGDTLEFVKTAAGFRWNKDLVTDNTLNDVYTPRREEDNDTTMWTVFNRSQEALVRGGVRIGPNDRRSRALGSINKALEVNTKLWELV